MKMNGLKEHIKPIVAIDLFAGAGGLTRGFLEAGIEVVAGIDIDRSAQKTYEFNNQVPYVNKDVCTITGSELKELLKGHESKTFLLAGCAPCQPFSTRNSKLKKDDDRKSLLREFTRLVKESNPDLVFMENVPGITSREPEMFQEFVNTLISEGFFVDKGVVNTKNFQVPQERKRFVLFASKKRIAMPEIINDDNEVVTVRQTIGKLPPLRAGEMTEEIPNHFSVPVNELNLKRLEQTPHDGGSRFDWKDPELTTACHRNVNGFKNSYGRLAWDQPAPTITTRFYTYSSGRHGHPEQNRAMSFREGALLQSFPVDYVFFGSTSEVGRQIGNAVPPRMSYWFGRHYLKHIRVT